MWTSWLIIICWQGNYRKGPLLWSNRGSFFWNQLITIRHIFLAFMKWSIGDGHRISYWYDSWGPEPIANLGSRQQNHAWSLADVVASLPTPYTLPELEDSSDELLWSATPSRRYSAASAYKTLAGIGLEKWKFRYVWSVPIPSSTKIFLFLLLKDKLLTREVMRRSNLNCQTDRCPMCQQSWIETGLETIWLALLKKIWILENWSHHCISGNLCYSDTLCRVPYPYWVRIAIGSGYVWYVFDTPVGVSEYVAYHFHSNTACKVGIQQGYIRDTF